MFGVRVFVYIRHVVVCRTSRVKMDVECVAEAAIYLIAAYNHHVNMVQRKVVDKNGGKDAGV